MRKRLSVFFLMAMFVITATFCVQPTLAAKKTTKIKATTNWKKAKTVKTGKIYKVTAKNKDGASESFLKFKAKKKGKYRFTFSKFRNASKQNTVGTLYNISICRYNGNKYFGPVDMRTVKTQGGKAEVLQCCDEKWNTAYEDKNSVRANLTSRYADIKLKKNEVVYIRTYQTDSAKYTYQLKIKKK